MAARERLLEAAEECFIRFGVAKTTIEDIARQAGVSRATVYRYFEGGRERLVIGVFLRELTRFHQQLRRHLRKFDSTGAQLVEIVEFTLAAIQDDTSLASLFAPDAVGLTTNVAGTSDALLQQTELLIGPLLERSHGELRPDLSTSDIAEWVLRNTLSLAAFPGPRRRTRAEIHEYLNRFMLPALIRPEATELTAQPAY